MKNIIINIIIIITKDIEIIDPIINGDGIDFLIELIDGSVELDI